MPLAMYDSWTGMLLLVFCLASDMVLTPTIWPP